MAAPTSTWWQRNGLLAGIFAPWLDFQLGTHGLALPPALSPASDPDSAMFWVSVGVAVAVALGALVWWLMRASTGARARHRVGMGLLVLWVLAWVGGVAQTLRSHHNRLGLQTPRDVTVKVVAVQVQPASVRSVGGAKVYVDWPAGGGLHTVVLESPTEDLLRKPAALTLTLAPGRFSGEFVTAWRVDNAAASTTPRPAP